MNEAREREYKPQFTLDILVGKTILEHRKVRNPKKENNPMYFDVVVFTDETFLLTRCWGDGECEHIYSYYYNGEKTKFSDGLFRPEIDYRS